jgi:hypothetical protein
VDNSGTAPGLSVSVAIDGCVSVSLRVLYYQTHRVLTDSISGQSGGGVRRVRDAAGLATARQSIVSTTVGSRYSGIRAYQSIQHFLRGDGQCGDVMSKPTNGSGSGNRDYANLTVSTEFRDKVRVAKAEAGLSYEDYLRQHVPIDTED